MKKVIIALLGAFLVLSVAARPAYPGRIVATQPDGSKITLQIHGDEWGHWLTDASGRVVEKGEDGYYHEVAGATSESMAQAAAISRRVRSAVSAQALQSDHVAVGQKHFLVILCEFSDVKFSTENVNQAVTSMLNSTGYSKNGATGSARDFYYESSNGIFEPIFDVYGPATLPNNMKYYGGNDSSGNDKHPEEAVEKGCKLLDDQIDFKNYDNDKDGVVDMVFMIYAGYGEADYDDSNTIWPHQYYMNASFDDMILYKYACSNELAGQGALAGKLDGIGAVCHEFGHAMGLPDFYDSDYTTNGNAGGMYDFSTMDAGCYNNSSRTPPFFNTEERILLGWVKESEAFTDILVDGPVTIPEYRPDQGSTVAYRTYTDMDGEYFVYECRGSQRWDSGLSGHGLLVYHVDKSSRKVSINGYSYSAYDLWANWESTNSINENGKHPCCYAIVAKDQSNLNYAPTYYQGYGYYYVDDGDKVVFPGTGNIKTYTPNSWNKVASEITFSDIAYTGSASTFTVSGVPVPTSGVSVPVIENPGNYTAGSQLDLSILPPSADYEYNSITWYMDGTAVQGTSVTFTSGSHVIEARIEKAGNKRDIVTLEIQVQ